MYKRIGLSKRQIARDIKKEKEIFVKKYLISFKENDLKGFIDNKFEEMKDLITNQTKTILKALGENSALMKKLIVQQLNGKENSKFPLSTVEQLEIFDKEINQENFNSYLVLARKQIYPDGFEKNFDKLLTEDLIYKFNYDGGHGKLSFKKYKNINNLFERAYDGANYINAVRHAFRLVKGRINKRAYKERQSIINKI